MIKFYSLLSKGRTYFCNLRWKIILFDKIEGTLTFAFIELNMIMICILNNANKIKGNGV